MCGRYSLIVDIQQVARRFGIVHVESAKMPSWQPRYNLAPTQSGLVITADHKLEEMRWGLIPHWSKEKKTNILLINARVETLKEKPSYKSLIKKHRCLVPADGFYEWQETKAGKQPHRIVRNDGSLFAFVGLYDIWQKGDVIVRSFTIITTEANTRLRQIHERMPVILTKENEERWLDLSSPLEELLIPYPLDDLAIYPVSKTVNSARVDLPECIQKASYEPLNH